MSPEIPLDDVASRSFSHSLRGYDPREVDAYLAELSAQVRRMQSKYLAARQQIGDLEDGDVESHIDATTLEINELLQTSRMAAESMRERAAVDAEAIRSNAGAESDRTLTSADADSFALRKSAWEASTEMVEQVRREIGVLHEQADRDALAIVGEAERNAHKKLAAARRDADTKVRTAGVEAERILLEGRRDCDEMIERATRATEAAQERTKALERRHENLMDELEELRLHRDSPPDPPSRGAAGTVRLIQPGATSPKPVDPSIDVEPSIQFEEQEREPRVAQPRVQRAPFADSSESVRLIDPSTVPEEVEVDADEIAVEVARLRSGVSTEETVEDNSVESGDDTGDDADEVDSGGGPPSDGASIEPPLDDQALAKAWSETPPIAAVSKDDLGSLFHELRVTDPPPTTKPRQRVSAGENAVSEDTSVEDLLPPEPINAFEVRDTALLPITNRVLRDIKRQLADVQNLQLDELKNDPANWQPDRDALESRLAQELIVVQRESFSTGYSSASTLLALEVDLARVDAPKGDTTQFISALFDEVVLTVQASREAGSTAKALGADVSRVYRVWRTDEAERRLRHLAGAAYHNGLLKGLAAGGVKNVRISVHDACGACKVRADMGLSVGDSGVLPIHDDCRCTIVPQ